MKAGSADGRAEALGNDVHRMWLFADGRLIWKSNLEGHADGEAWRFGTTSPTTAVIAQRLTADGVNLVRSPLLAEATPPVSVSILEPGVIWGEFRVRVGDELRTVGWRDPDLPGRLSVPGNWLPESAWADRELRGSVPSAFAICFGYWDSTAGTRMKPSQVMALLPEPTQDLIGSRATAYAAPTSRLSGCVAQVTTEDARAIVAALDADRAKCDSLARLR